jgi:hypothetical protein
MIPAFVRLRVTTLRPMFIARHCLKKEKEGKGKEKEKKEKENERKEKYKKGRCKARCARSEAQA